MSEGLNKSDWSWRRHLAFLLPLLGMGLAGCAKPEGAGPLPLDAVPPFSATGEVEAPQRWWTTFEDAALNEHVDRALDENFSLAAAWQRLQAAEAVARREAAFLLPALDAVVGADVVESTAGGGAENGGGDGASLLLGLEATYEVDLWGRIESLVEAEQLRASATRADYRTAALSLAAEVARTWYQLVEARLQLALVEEQIETNQTILDLLRTRFNRGQIRGADVLRQRQLLEATQEQAIIVRARARVLANLLAVLRGEPPQAARDTAAAQLPALPPVPATGLPGELVRRRPDVQAAFLLLQAADRDLAAAVSAQYPRVNLVASLATEAESPEDLFRDYIVSIGGQMIAPLFDGGERRAEVERAAAVERLRLAEYGQTVLAAFREVEDALALEKYQLQRIQSLEQQLSTARDTYEQLLTQYRNGVADYLAVLDVLTEQQRLQRDLLTARLAVVEYRIALYRALAGGFETRRERQGQ